MHYVDLYMFEYQRSFRIGLEILAKGVFEKIGADITPRVLLVGAKAPQATARHPVCLEPEDDEWDLQPFADLLEQIESIIPGHPLQNMIYGDAPRMREKPENIRRSSVRMAVHAALKNGDKENARRSFCGYPMLVDSYYVVPVLQVPEKLFEQFPPLEQPDTDDPRIPRGVVSFVQACIGELLSAASDELRLPEPGRGAKFGGQKSEEIVRRAASNFMRTPAYMVSGHYVPGDLLERFNMISSLMYEGVHGVGQLVLADPKSAAIDYLLRFDEPVPFREPRWARKILQMASKDVALIADSELIYGLGQINSDRDLDGSPVFIVDFLDHYHWEVRLGERGLLRCRFGEPTLPQEPITQDRFIDNYSRLFPASSLDARQRMWELFCNAVQQKHGSMIVVAQDAEFEARRLARQGTTIQAVKITSALFERASGIDGTILVDPEGTCHAVGVILDGMATSACTPSRGSRFNSGVRYVSSGNSARLAIVVSDDRTVDVFPLLRPRVGRDEIEKMVSTLENATSNNYYRSRNWLDEHRFYLNADQCWRVNAALKRIEASMEGERSIIFRVSEFSPDSDMNDGYLNP